VIKSQSHFSFLLTGVSVILLAACGQGGGSEAAAAQSSASPEPSQSASASETEETAEGAEPEEAATETAVAAESPEAEPSALTAAPASTASEPPAAVARPAAFASCAACHSVERGAAATVGPNLFGVVGSNAGRSAGFSYSPAMQDSQIRWTRGNLDRFLADPAGVVPGTRMGIPGTRDAAARTAIIDYLETLR